MNTNTENNIISEFDQQRKQNRELNKPTDDIKIIQNIAISLKMDFSEVLNIVENNKNNRPQSYNNSIISEFDQQTKQNRELNKPANDVKIIQNIANNLKMDFSEVLNIIEKGKNNRMPMGKIKTFPTA